MCVFNLRPTTYVLLFQIIFWYQLKSTNAILGETEPVEAESNEFPFVVALVAIKKNILWLIEDKRFCGGALISRKHVLTAAHCLQNQKIHDRQGSFQVVVGSNDLRKGTVYDIEWFETYEEFANRTEIHNSYVINDVAVIRLRAFVDHTLVGSLDFFFPPKKYYKKDVIMVGWGPTNNELAPRMLRKAPLKVIDKREESPNTPYFYNQYQVTGDPRFVAQNGDGGSPLLVLNDQPCSSQKKYKIIGIVVSIFPEFAVLMDLDKRTVAMAVKSYETFINAALKLTGEDNDEPIDEFAK